MEGISYWQQVWGGDWVERQRINQAAAELGALGSETGYLNGQVARLFELDRVQGREIARAEAAIWVLMQMLAETGVLDLERMSARIKHAFEEMEPKAAPPAQGTAGNPYR